MTSQTNLLLIISTNINKFLTKSLMSFKTLKYIYLYFHGALSIISMECEKSIAHTYFLWGVLVFPLDALLALYVKLDPDLDHIETCIIVFIKYSQWYRIFILVHCIIMLILLLSWMRRRIREISEEE
jgi:hypothetical protein